MNWANRLCVRDVFPSPSRRLQSARRIPFRLLLTRGRRTLFPRFRIVVAVGSGRGWRVWRHLVSVHAPVRAGGRSDVAAVVGIDGELSRSGKFHSVPGWRNAVRCTPGIIFTQSDWTHMTTRTCTTTAIEVTTVLLCPGRKRGELVGRPYKLNQRITSMRLKSYRDLWQGGDRVSPTCIMFEEG